MGCAITDILEAKEIGLAELNGKILAVDAMNQLYMFLSSIRGADGSYLMDSKGNVTSHLSGLFFRFAKLMQEGLRFVFVFDGEMPELKKKERERRHKLKLEAEKEYEDAKQKQDLEAMKKYASRTTRLTPEMKEEAKKLIAAMGMPIVQAPQEGEAQAAHLVQKQQCYGVMSQDADSLLFASPRVIKNLSITKRRKQASKLAYSSVAPELIVLQDNLKALGLSQDQLIVLGILVGTDFNIGGVKGIGSKKALKLLKEYGSDFEKLFEAAKWSEYFDYSWKEVFDIFKHPKVTEDYSLEWKEMDYDEIVKVLVDEHEFSRQRVEDALENLRKRSATQKGLGEYF